MDADTPTGRVTNAEVAKYVAEKIADARTEIREEEQALHSTLREWIQAYVDTRLSALKDSVGDDHRRFRLEIRAWLAAATAFSALHSSGAVTAVAGVLGSIAGVGFLSRFLHR